STAVAAAGPLAARIEELRTKYDVWAFADHLDTAALPKDAPDPLRGIDRFWFGAAISKGIELTAEAHAATPQDAEKLSSLIRGWEALARMQMKESEGVKLDLQSSEGNLRLSISVSEAELKKAMQTRNQTASNPVSTKPTIVNLEPVITRDSVGNTVTLTLPGK